MEPELYEELAHIEDSHWWFRGRRAIVQALMDKCTLEPDSKILEAGCGSGGNLPMLAEFGSVYGFEMHDLARQFAQKRGIGQIEAGWLPDAVPFHNHSFDLVALFDVLEHIEDDRASLQRLYSMTAPGGHILITVPAFPVLWSLRDTLHHHKRRYTRNELVQKVTDAGFTINYISHFNFWLFPIAYLTHWLDTVLSSTHFTKGSMILPRPINWLLYQIMASESWLLRFFRLPFGISLVLLASRPASPSQ